MRRIGNEIGLFPVGHMKNLKDWGVYTSRPPLYPPEEFEGRMHRPPGCLPVVCIESEKGRRYPDFECIAYTDSDSYFDGGQWNIPREGTLTRVSNAIPGRTYVASPLSYPAAALLTPSAVVYDVLIGIPCGTIVYFALKDIGKIGMWRIESIFKKPNFSL